MASSGSVEGGTATVLVVHDGPARARLFARLLQPFGCRVLAVDDAQAALALATAEPPDLILLGAGIPGADGDALCERLKAASDPRLRDIPVVFVAGDPNARLREGIAERQRAESRFRGVLESAPEAMVIVDAARRIALVNSQAENLFGYRREEMLGRCVEMLLPERFRDSHALLGVGYAAQPRRRPMGKGRGLFGLSKDGREFPAEISLSPLSDDDDTLVICAIRDFSERMQIEQELIASREKLRELAAHRDAVREIERKRIAGEIHDELGALLTALKMDIALLRMNVGTNADLQQRVGQMRELVEQTIQGVRRVATQLRPAALNLGVVPAVEWLVADLGRRTAIECSFESCCEIEMDDAQATAVFRIVQESLTNVARHAGASAVTVILARSDRGVEVRIRDDGRGFDIGALRGDTFGLLGLRERALALGATLRIDSAPGRGTLIALTIPDVS